MKHILLLDDDLHVLTALRRTLRPFLLQHEIRVEAFCDPEQALLRCADMAFDVVVSDYRMPGLTGADFLQMMKGIQPDAVRVMLSASTDFAEVSHAINRGEVFRYVTKPWNGADLEAIFLEAFARRKALLASRPQAALSRQELEARKLEQDEPGITSVHCDEHGAVYLD